MNARNQSNACFCLVCVSVWFVFVFVGLVSPSTIYLAFVLTNLRVFFSSSLSISFPSPSTPRHSEPAPRAKGIVVSLCLYPGDLAEVQRNVPRTVGVHTAQKHASDVVEVKEVQCMRKPKDSWDFGGGIARFYRVCAFILNPPESANMKPD